MLEELSRSSNRSEQKARRKGCKAQNLRGLDETVTVGNIHPVSPVMVAVKDDDDDDDDDDGKGATHSIVLDGISACTIIPRVNHRTSLGLTSVRNSSVIAQWWKSLQHLCLSQRKIAKANCKVSPVCSALLNP